jgi:WD40 repeat protein
VKAVAFSPDGQQILSISTDSTVLLWDTSSRKPLTTAIQGMDNSLEAAAFSPDGRRVLAIFSDSSAHLLDVASISHVTLGCQRLHRHHRLWHSEAAKDSQDFATLIREAKGVCRRLQSGPPHSQARFPLPDFDSPLQWLRHTLRLG